MQYYLAPPPLNPLARILAGVLALAALVGAFFFGLIILLLAIGLGVLGWLFLTFRVWQLRRRQARGDGGVRNGSQSRGHQSRQGDAIDAEYEVISDREED
jgi:hypothetical protein